MPEMQNELVAKQANKLIESVYRMEANEQKIILLATQIVNKMEHEGHTVSADTEIVIKAHEYADAFGVSRQAAFRTICDAKNTIYERSFEIDYTDAHGVVKPTSSRWIHRKGEVSANSEISIFFAPAVIPLIYYVKGEFTLMDLREIGRLKSKFAVRLYKLLMQWKNAKYQKVFSYEELRDILGLEPDEYPDKYDFKKRVLNIGVEQINKGTSFINLRYSGVKSGKVITHFTFEYDSYDSQTVNITPISRKNEKVKKTDVRSDSKSASSASDEVEVESIKQKPMKQVKAPKAPNIGYSADTYTNHKMSAAQAGNFAGQIAAALQTNQAPFAHLNEIAPQGADYKTFREKIKLDLMNGNTEPYFKALELLSYHQYNK